MMKTLLWGAFAATMLSASAAERMRYLYSDKETIVSPYPCEVIAHPYLSDGCPVVSAAAGESFGPLEAGSYLIQETLAPGKVRTRYLAVVKPGWTVVQLTCGTTGDKLDSVVHPRRIPMNYYVGVDEAQKDTTFLGWQRDYGDEILLHLHPDSLGKIDQKFKTLKENWEAFTVPEIIDRLKALDAWMQDFGFKPLRGFASYTPANTLVAAMREVGWDILHSIIPEQNWSDGHWAINHWGMPNQPFYIAADDFRKSVARGTAGNDVLGMGMNSYHLYMPHVVMWGDNVCSPSHFLRWHRTVESGDMPVRYENFLDDYLKVAEGMTDSPYFLFTGYEFGRTFGTRSMTVHNRAGCELAIDKAKNGGKVVFATASDVADWFERFRPTPSENVFTQRDYLAGTRIMDKPIDSGPSIAMEMKDYKACFAHLEQLPFYHYDYTIPWHFKAADTTAPSDFASFDAKSLKVEERGPSFAKATEGREGEERTVTVSVAKTLPRVTPVCLWDRELVDKPTGVRVFVPPVLDDGRRHTVVELPKGFRGELILRCRVTGAPDKAEFGGLVTPLWRVQTIGAGDRRHCYAFADVPLLSPCIVRFVCPRDCRIDALEKPLGAFKKGDVVELAFTTRRTWYRFWGLTAGEIQPDAAGVAALERAAAEWKSFSDNASANLAKTHAEDDAFFKSVVPKDEKLVLDVDCFGNAVFGERSRARPFDRCVFAANDKVTAKEYSDGGISYGRGKSFWVHPRGLGLQVEGLDTLGLNPDAMLRIRLCTVAEKDEPLSYKVMVRSGWKKILGYADEGQKPLVWNCPKVRTPEGLFSFDVPFKDVSDGVLGIQLRTNQKQILDDWFADGGFIARLERIVVTEVKSEPQTASFADFDARAKAGEKLAVAFFGGSLTWSANAPAPRAPYPELVAIPGGTFTMGAKAVEPDEGTPREVTVSPFRMGKYEVTNLEYEQFRPQHRAKRTALSWRDDEPVVYVSWNDAAAYCNWLSSREGLTPAYDAAKGMARVEGANGYRLPTEAEWEYVATGRGENRTYPWGEEPPQGMCNGASPKDVLQAVDLYRNKTANRAVCVGSYATDVSRDGICDMGGNVLEWCHDNYHYDAPQEGRDPCDVRPAKSGRMNFRAIRGGGYGYYGLSHRCCDREYNNPGYPGYVYIGFRVVKPQPVLIVNGDNDHYFRAGQLSRELPIAERFSVRGLERYVDIMTRGGKVTHLFMCAVGQRADYDSKVCDPIWMAIDEAKARGLEPHEWPVNAKKLHDLGIDPFKVWCDYCRRTGKASLWISQRMNDVHHVSADWNMRTNRFWWDHPELWRKPNADRKSVGSWTDVALDYSHPEVREFEFAIFKELVDRYDADGFELDFMRFWEHLTPGREREQAPILTDFIRRCRRYADEVGARRGRRIGLATRCPTSYAAARDFGFDPETWAREGLIDILAVANFWAADDYDFDFANWKSRISAANPKVIVVPSVGDNISCGSDVVPASSAALKGWADNVQADGAEGLYVFNVAYLCREALDLVLDDGLAGPECAKGPRRYICSFHDCVKTSEQAERQLPRKLDGGAELTIRVGRPSGNAASVILGFDRDCPAPGLRINGLSAGAGEPLNALTPYGKTVKCAWRFELQPEALRGGRNRLSISSIPGVSVVWAEIVD